MTTQPPSQIGRYRIERELGRGTMGVVYEARDTTLGRTVALKTFGAMAVIAPHEREAFEERFLSEARISATLEEPHVVAVFDIGRDPDTDLLYMALEYVKGETLASTLSRGPLPWQEAAAIVAKVARALQAAHSHHIVHRDIKPANIMLNTQGEPKIMDFGIAKASAAQLTVAGQVFGTPAYMSPEQATGDDVDGRSDIFSLGAVLYELVTNTRPFEAPTMATTLTKILHDEPPPASSIAGVPRGLDAIIARALRKGRDERYDTAAHLAADLENLLAGKLPQYATQLKPLETVSLRAGQTPRRTAPPPPKAPPGGEHVYVVADDEPVPRTLPWRTIGGVAVGVALGIAAVLLLQRSESPAETSLGMATPAPTAGMSQTAAATPTSPPGPMPTAAALSLTGARDPARISLDLRHPFASGTLRIKLDEQVVFASNIHGMPRRVMGVDDGYDGRFGTDLEMPPGAHVIQVEVRSGSTAFVESTRVDLQSGETRRLLALVGKTMTLSLE